MDKTRYDAMVIGSGAAGSVAAQELTAQGLKVILLEAGPEIGPKDLDPAKKKKVPNQINLLQRAHATLAGQHVQARAAYFAGSLAHLFVNDRENGYTTPPDAPFLWIRGRQGGGRTHTFGRVLMRWSDDDFRLRERSGEGIDWPISYDDVKPFYEEVERTLGIYGNADGIPTQPDSIFVGPAKPSPAEQSFKTNVENRWPERCVTSWRSVAPEPSRVSRPLQAALKSGNMTVRYNSVVRCITTDATTGLATGAEIIDRHTGETVRIAAASVVVCASPIESVRLLLNSASKAHPHGLCNGSGTLGRYFMDQLPCVASGDYPPVSGSYDDDSMPSDPYFPTLSGVFVTRFVGKDGHATNKFDFQIRIGRSPVPPGTPARLDFFGFGMMMPDAENRITLDPARKDTHGIPVAHIRCKMTKTDEALLRQQVDTMVEIIEGVGGRLEFAGSPLGLIEKGRGAFPDLSVLHRFIFRRMFRKTMVMGAAIHETGGARMGNHSTTSVLNSWNQSWEVRNLFVTDASAFPTAGVTGTTLTVMALTLRACRHLAEEYRAGRI